MKIHKKRIRAQTRFGEWRCDYLLFFRHEYFTVMFKVIFTNKKSFLFYIFMKND